MGKGGGVGLNKLSTVYAVSWVMEGKYLLCIVGLIYFVLRYDFKRFVV